MITKHLRVVLSTTWLLALIVVVALVLSSCASFIKTSHDGLAVSYNSYDVALSVAGDLYKEGRISEAQKTKIIEVANLYMAAHNQAVYALANYKQNETDENKNIYLMAAGDVAVRLSALIALVQLNGGVI